MAHRYQDFDQGTLPWLDRPDALEAIEAKLAGGEIDQEQAGWLRKWHQDGYLVFEGLFDAEIAEGINADVQAIYDEYGHLPLHELREHFKNAYHRSEWTCRALVLPQVLERLDLLLGARMIPHQTLNLPVSSQQKAHSDQILMTTQPIGFMAAAWFALEDIDSECGPLLVYPGSHRLSYVSAEEVGIPREATPPEVDRIYDERYYDMIETRIRESGVEPWAFVPKQGDVLVWHSNLLHAAALIEREGATRRSLIAHYFADHTQHYSDMYGWDCISPELRDPAR